MLLYDVTSDRSFCAVRHWVNSIDVSQISSKGEVTLFLMFWNSVCGEPDDRSITQEVSEKRIPIILCGNKASKRQEFYKFLRVEQKFLRIQCDASFGKLGGPENSRTGWRKKVQILFQLFFSKCFFSKSKKYGQEAHIEGVLVQRMVKRWLASTGCNFSPQANPLEVGTFPLDHIHLDAPPLAQRHLHGDQLEGREEHLGLTGHAGKGDVRQWGCWGETNWFEDQ